MARGTAYGTERIDRTDQSTGLLVRQVTSSPTPSLHLHYETPTFTPDGGHMLVIAMRYPGRGAPFDLLAMGSDGTDPIQLSGSGPDGASSATITADGIHAVYMEGGTCHRTRLDDAADEEIGHLEGASHYKYDFGARTRDGCYYISIVRYKGHLAWVRWDLETGDPTIVVESDLINHPMANPGGQRHPRRRSTPAAGRFLPAGEDLGRRRNA